MELGRLDKAAADFAKAYQFGPVSPGDAYAWYRQALAQLGSGDTAGYRQTCADMLEHFSQTDDPSAAFWVAWSCVLAPDVVEDMREIVRLAEKAMEHDRTNTQYLTHLGAVLYRAGRPEEAIQRFNAVVDAWEQSGEMPTGTSPAYTWFFLAMAHHQLGHGDDARWWLDQAVEWAEQELAGEPAWNRRLTLQMLRREAEALIHGKGVVVAGNP